MNSIVSIIMMAAIGNIIHISAAPVVSKVSTRGESAQAAKDRNTRVVMEGDALNLDCEAFGTIQPSFHWLFQGKYIEQSPLDAYATNLISSSVKHTQINVKANLNIKNVNPTHAGIYICIADSITKRVTTTFNVIVTKKGTEKTEDKTSEVNANLRIYEWTEEIQQEEGQTMYAVCRATQGLTQPMPNIRWTIGDKDIKESDNIMIHSNGDLEVKRVTLKFHFWEGDLTCHATSEDGQTVVKKVTWVYVIPLVDNEDKIPHNML